MENGANNGKPLSSFLLYNFLYIFTHFVDIWTKREKHFNIRKNRKYLTGKPLENQISDPSMLCSALRNVLGTGSNLNMQIIPLLPAGNLQSSIHPWDWRGR